MESYGSFPNDMNRDESIDTWYFDIRADILLEDELNYELAVRDILIDRDRSRMRGCLRLKLKSEKEAGLTTARNLKNSVMQEIAICRQKLDEIETIFKEGKPERIAMLKSRLLHLAARLKLAIGSASPIEKDDLRSIYCAAMDHLYHYYYSNDTVESDPESEEEQENESELTLEKLIQRAGTSKTLQVDKEVLVRELIRQRQANEMENQLKNEVKALQNEIAAAHQQSQVGNQSVQTDDINHLFAQWQISNAASTITTPTTTTTSSLTPGLGSNLNQIPKSVSFSVPSTYDLGAAHSSAFASHLSYTTLNNPIPSPYPQPPFWYQTPFPPNPHVGIPQQFLKQSSSFSQIPPNQNLSLPFNPQPQPQLQTQPHPQLLAQPQLQSQSQLQQNQPNLNYNHPYYPQLPATPQLQPQLQVPNVHQLNNHKTLPVSKWVIDKYAGDDQGLNLNEFLFHVKSYATSENVSDDELFNSALHLFTGPALNWYQSMRTSGRLYNWDHLVLELKNSFVHPDLDSIIRVKAYLRKQQRNESFQSYYFDMEKLFRSMTVQMPELEKKKLVQQNMRSDYRKQLTFMQIPDLPTLNAFGRVIDAGNFSLYNKMFGSEKSVNMVSEPTEKKSEANKIPQLAPQQTHIQPANNNNNNSRQNQPPGNQNNYQPRGNQGNYQIRGGSNTQHQGNQYRANPTTTTTNQSAQNLAQPSGSGLNNLNRTASAPSALDRLVDEWRPPNPNVCYNCSRTQHHHEECREPKRVFCLICGFKGFETLNCPYCRKNGIQTAASRAPSNNQQRN